jgi:hypothetical protein
MEIIINKVLVKEKTNLKNSSILKGTRFIVYCSSYSNTIMPFLSKAAPMMVQFQ